MMHFEELWENCEKLYNDCNKNEVQSLIDELLIKINLYKAVDQKSELSNDKTIKSRFYGEILLSLTKISKLDDINVFEALMSAYQERII